ncbi:MAG: Oligoendopeptidase F, plasmid [Chlamydiae bacterium]|nr:Oligoendopeptidase F, plasmid [Chlamydiota bacterium]
MTVWELDSIYASDAAFSEEVSRVKELLVGEDILKLQEAGMLLKQLDSYVSCLMAQDPSDQAAHVKNGELSGLSAAYEGALFKLANRLAEMEEADFQQLLEEFSEIAFYIEELREVAKRKGTKEQEELINALSADGYHSFWSLYQSFTGKIKVGKEGLSIGQAYNLLSDANRQVRQQAFKDWNEAWEKDADFLAQLLNHLAGFRLKVYEARGWDDILDEPLFLNRMEPETLNAMWHAIEEAKPAFLRYLEHKAKLLGLEKLSWVDVEAPLGEVAEIPWETACEIIVEQFGKFHPKKAEFAKGVLEKQWVEAEDRKGKAAGGFCVMLPKSGESRIFMTYKGTPINVATLAHELGHAYHNECVKDLPYFYQQMQMNVAETASTFGEAVVIDQVIKGAKTDEERMQLLDDKLQRAVAYFMNLQARLIFEKAFYEERKQGFVSVERLCDLMVAAQKEAYCDALADWDPYFWASKLHFYYTHFPFYNFPYTFGYLLSTGLYARAKEGDFGPKFDAFLADTGQMRVEDLAEKHLGVDLRKPDFWRDCLDVLVKDVDKFINPLSIEN